MTFRELSGCGLSAIGGLALGVVAYANWGWPVSLVGVLAGVVAGWLVAGGLVSVADWIGIRRERNTRRTDLSGRFGSYWSEDRAAAWNRLLETTRRGDSMSGGVVQKYYYGVFIDVGTGFPALLTRLHMDPTMPEEVLDVGAQVSAHVSRFDHKEHIVELTQRSETSKVSSARLLR